MYKTVRAPILAPILASRRLALALFIIGSAQAALTLSGYGIWQCPIQSTLGLPCPGCGVSRGVASLVSGHWQSAIHFHLLSPIVLGAILMLGAISLLPQNSHNMAVQIVAGVEKNTGISYWFIFGMLAIWAYRIVAGFRPGWIINR